MSSVPALDVLDTQAFSSKDVFTHMKMYVVCSWMSEWDSSHLSVD